MYHISFTNNLVTQSSTGATDVEKTRRLNYMSPLSTFKEQVDQLNIDPDDVSRCYNRSLRAVLGIFPNEDYVLTPRSSAKLGGIGDRLSKQIDELREVDKKTM